MICHNCLKEIFESRGYCTSCHEEALDEAEKEAKIPLWHSRDIKPDKEDYYLVDSLKWSHPESALYENGKWTIFPSWYLEQIELWTEFPERMK